ncbi:uncharacterized protein LOC131017855 [Salvia miltiorrhiza]|uniref:uncharacterized protein LOC131017855 n=1 Tax=Salvia miltiorrhiza TaxID=226208 RepID=UPI0025AC600D|nr:uncharacterized protein LOC131017855 [Salvia miltiorrhiza]
MASEALDSLLQTLRQILNRKDDIITPRVKQRIISIHDKAVLLQLNLKHFPKEATIREVVNTTQEIIEYIFSPENISDCASTEASVRLSIQLGELAEELASTAGDVVDYCKSPDDLVNNVRRRSDSSSRSAIELIVNLIYLLVRVVRIMSTARYFVDYYFGLDDLVAGRYFVNYSRFVGYFDYSKHLNDLKDFDVDLRVATELTVSISIRFLSLAERIMSTTSDSLDNVGRLSDSPASSRFEFKSEDFDGLDEDLILATALFVSSNRLARLGERIKWTARDLVDNSNPVDSSPTSALKIEDFDGFGEDLDSVSMRTLDISHLLGRFVERIMSTAKDSVANTGRFSDSLAVATELIDSISNRLERLAERIMSTAEDSVNNLGRLSDSPAVDSSSRSALRSEDFGGFDEDLTVATELTVSISNRLGRLAERIKWTAVGSSSRSLPTSKDVVVGFDEDRLQIMSWLTSYSSELQVLPIVGMGGIDAEY